jgi:hypothetical protein
MGIRKPNLQVVLWSGLLLALTIAGTACHSDKNQARLPAPQANAPKLVPALAAPASRARLGSFDSEQGRPGGVGIRDDDCRAENEYLAAEENSRLTIWKLPSGV